MVMILGLIAVSSVGVTMMFISCMVYDLFV